jgi:hypothetical protein
LAKNFRNTEKLENTFFKEVLTCLKILKPIDFKSYDEDSIAVDLYLNCLRSAP